MRPVRKLAPAHPAQEIASLQRLVGDHGNSAFQGGGQQFGFRGPRSHRVAELDEIDPMFFYKPYYLEPQKGGDKAYVLLRDALSDTKKVGIAKVVIKTRQYLAGVKAENSVLVLELMHFAEELADANKLHIPRKLEPGKRYVLDLRVETVRNGKTITAAKEVVFQANTEQRLSFPTLDAEP